MIVFDLRCRVGHVFEAWFGSSAAFEAQRDAGQIACPLCGDTDIVKAVMAPAIAAKASDGTVSPSPARVKRALAILAGRQAEALKDSTWVGSDFATRARAMHMGDEPAALIHGQATGAEAKLLIAEGVPVAPLPLPVVPPETSH